MKRDPVNFAWVIAGLVIFAYFDQERGLLLSLRTRFYIFSLLFLSIVLLFGGAVVLRGVENNRASRQIESDLQEISLLVELESQLERLREDLHHYQETGKHPEGKTALVLENAGMNIQRLFEFVEKDEFENNDEQTEMVAVKNMEQSMSELQALYLSIETGKVSPAKLASDQQRIFSDLYGSLELFHQGALDEVHKTLSGLRKQQKSLEALVINGTIFLIFLLVLGWFVFTYGLLKPVRRLHRMTRRLSKIDFDLELESVPKGELGDLTRSFLSMARALESFTREMESRVAERTRELSFAKAQQSFMLENIPDAVGVLSPGKGVIAGNTAYRKLFSSEGNDPLDLSQIGTKTPQGYLRVKMPNEGEKLFDVQRFSKAMEEDDDQLLTLEYIRDVTRMSEVENALAQSQRLVALGRLSAGIAHEVGGPLTAIAACAEGLLEREKKGETDKKELNEYLGVIQEEVYRCKDLTERLLDLSRQKDHSKITTDLSTLLNDCMRLVSYLNKKKGIKVSYEGPDQLEIFTSPTAVKQICLNLLMNANQVCSQGGAIKVELQDQGDQAVICVKDDGEGIAPEYIDSVFDPFFTRKKSEKGTGLGLFLSKELAGAIGGKLTVYSEGVGKGACFTLTVPQKRINITDQSSTLDKENDK